MKNKKIGFVGMGWIGKNYYNDFKRRGYEVVPYSLEEPYKKNKNRIKSCDIVFVAVPTPTTPQGFCYKNITKVLPLIGKGKIVVIKSTILPYVVDRLQQRFPKLYIMHSPEFLTEATAAFDSANPARNIVGIPKDTKLYRKKAQEVMDILPYAPYKLICSAEEASFIKYGGNNWFYFKVVYMNMLFDLSKKFESIDFDVVKQAMANDPRIGFTHLDVVHKGGRGAGGHCFIKDFNCFREMLGEHRSLIPEIDVAEYVEMYNLRLLGMSNKDKDIVKGVYGKEYIKKLYEN